MITLQCDKAQLTICGAFEEGASFFLADKDYTFLQRSLTRDISASLRQHHICILI